MLKKQKNKTPDFCMLKDEDNVLFESCTTRLCSCPVLCMGGRKKERKEGELDYQRENVDKNPHVAIAIFHRKERVGILLW